MSVVRKYCLPDGGWPLTPSLTTVHNGCPTGFTGSVNRECGDGVWGEGRYDCERVACPAEDGWSALGGATQVRECGRGYNGTMSRACSAAGEWQEIDRSECGTCSEDR